MLNGTRLKNLYEGPMPPMALTDYDTMSKFLDSAAQRCKASGRDFGPFLDWTIRALLASLTADSASRIFVPKTRTAPFLLEELLPLPEVPMSRRRIRLSKTNLVAPVWNNCDLEQALEAFCDSGFQDAEIDRPFGGVYLEELNLAVVDSPADVDVPCVLRAWSRGSILMDAVSLGALAPALSTDGQNWYIQESDGGESVVPVLEPRMAALYNCGLRRYCPEL